MNQQRKVCNLQGNVCCSFFLKKKNPHIVSLKMLCLLAFSLLGDKLKFSDYIRIASIEFENKMNFQSSPHGMETIELQMNLLKFKPDSSPSQSLLKWDG